MVAQPRVKENILASLLTKNANEYAAQQEWEAEWNQAGLASRLSEKVWLRMMSLVRVYIIVGTIGNCVGVTHIAWVLHIFSME